MPESADIPSTVQRSPKHAQALWSKTHAAAVAEYGHGRRAQQTAFAALKNEFEKVGDHWERKAESGPSDPGSEKRGAKTEGGVDANASKAHLLDLAKRLDVTGRSRMTKAELVEALRKANDRATAKSR